MIKTNSTPMMNSSEPSPEATIKYTLFSLSLSPIKQKSWIV